MPPHEHRMAVHIGMITGVERHLIYTKNSDSWRLENTMDAEAGRVVSLSKDALHAITSGPNKASDALHVYMGPLTKIKRDLFDWNTGSPVEFSEENFENLKRPRSDFTALDSI